MEEYVDILDENGNITGEVITKKEAHKTGKWHRAVHIWIISEDKKCILLQKSPATKKSQSLRYGFSGGDGDDTYLPHTLYDNVYCCNIQKNFQALM